MFKKIIRNKKGTAEVIGTIMFVVILMYFFANVYLWHDTATREMSNLAVNKINSPITVTIESTSPFILNVTDVGGQAATLSILWVDENSPNSNHFSITQNVAGVVVAPQSYYEINLGNNSPSPSTTVDFKVITTVGNYASCSYPPQ